MAEQKAFLDYRQTGDTGADSAASIQPLKNGEYADETTFNRPLENLRQRSEIVRAQVQDLLYYRDRGQVLFELTPTSTATWGGPTTGGGTGVLTVTGTLKISPFSAPAAPVRGSLATGAAGTNQLTYSLSSSTYASQGTNAITVEHRATTGQQLAVSIVDGPVYHVLVQFDSGNVNHTNSAAKAALDTAIAANAFLAGKLTTAVDGTGVLAALAETRISGSADDESHWVLGTSITNLTSVRKLNIGDGIGIWYKYLIEPDNDPADPKGNVAGGRAESSVTRNNHNIPAGSLFVTSDSASKIPGAIIICRVAYNGQLVFADGTRVAPGESTKFESVTTTLNAQLTNYVTSSSLSSTLGNYSTTSAMNTAISNAVANRATTTYVDTQINTRTTPTAVNSQIDTKLTGYATQTWVQQQGYSTGSGVSQTYVDNQVATRTTPTQVNTQIDAKLTGYATQTWVQQQGYSTGGGGVSQAYVDGQVATRTTPTAVNTQILAANSTGTVQLLDVYYALQAPGTSGAGIYINAILVHRDGTLIRITGLYNMSDVLAPETTIVANKWIYLYAYNHGGTWKPVLSDQGTYSENNNYNASPPFSSRMNGYGFYLPNSVGGGTVGNNTMPCFGALRTLGNGIFMQQVCNRNILYGTYGALNNLTNYAASTLTTALVDEFWPFNARAVRVTGSASTAATSSTSVYLYYPFNATNWATAEAFTSLTVLAGHQTSHAYTIAAHLARSYFYGAEIPGNKAASLDLREVHF